MQQEKIKIILKNMLERFGSRQVEFALRVNLMTYCPADRLRILFELKHALER